MKKYIVTCFVFIGIIIAIISGIVSFSSSQSTGTQMAHQTFRQTQAIFLNTKKQAISVEATRLPEFRYDLSDKKFNAILTAGNVLVKQFAKVSIVNKIFAKEKMPAAVSVDQSKKQLVVTPEDMPNLKPGMYHLSLQLRTIEGVVNVEQDFSWGVIAVNTNKSIYKPGETAKIGLGVLNDKGETLCMTGLFNHVDDLSMVITDPQGHAQNFSIKDKTILDSGKCGANTVTNDADFQATYLTKTAGIYQMKVTAVVYGREREIEDYFKVDPSVQFDVERTSFPTRIYPPAPYPVTFTVTAKADYQGIVEDVVPANFVIDHISDNGQSEKDGDFTKIIWQVNLKAGTPKTFNYFIEFPKISPEFYLLGPITIGSFKEARQWQIASDAINSSTGVLSYEDNTTQNTWYRTWSGTTFSAQGNMSTGAGTPTNSKWFSEKSSPKTGEKLVAVLDADTADTVYIYRWTGSAWVNDIRIVMTSDTTSNQSRCVDVAFEQSSGDAIFAYANKNSGTNPNKIFYRKYNSSTHTWDSSDSVTTTATNPKAWIKLVSLKNSDNILMGYVNNVDNHVGAEIWNGSAWNNEIVDNAANSPTAASGHIDQTFDIAWETNSQAAMLVWGNTSSGLTYRRFSSGSWSSETSSGLSFPANVAWVNAVSDDSSSSNNIAVSTQDLAATPNCKFAVWNGSTWTLDGTNSAITCQAHTTTGGGSSRENNVIFEHGTGKAVWVYIRSSDTTHLHYHTWTSGGGFTADVTTNATALANPAIAVNLYSDSYTVGIIALVTYGSLTSGSAVTIRDQEWDGSSWTAPGANNGNADLFANVQASDEHCEAYGFGFDLNLETQVAYRWFADSPGTNTSVDTALAAQDTPYKLTTANQKFRLRMLLYYPDSLSSSARSYILQAVDPGGGSCASPDGTGSPPDWKDMPNVNDTSTSLAYYDNTSVASASAITANASLDPTYNGKTKVNETYNEQNTFTTNTAVSGDNVGLFDFSLIDKTTFGPQAHTFCFRVKRSSGIVLQIGNFPQITTASLNDVLIQGGSLIQGGTKIQ